VLVKAPSSGDLSCADLVALRGESSLKLWTVILMKGTGHLEGMSLRVRALLTQSAELPGQWVYHKRMQRSVGLGVICLGSAQRKRSRAGWWVGERGEKVGWLEKEKRRGKRVALEISGGLLGRLGSHY
jgi:hypothetical protein